MKAAFTLALVATVVAVAAAAPSTLVVDWNNVHQSINGLRDVINGAVDQVRSTAVADNPVVGSQIARDLNLANGRANGLLGEAQRMADAMTLTRPEAQRILNGMNQVLEEAKATLTPAVGQLSPEAQQQIRDCVDTASRDAQAHANALLSALDGNLMGALVVDWDAVILMIDGLRNTIDGAVGRIRTIAVEDNPVVGHDIAREVNIANSDAKRELGVMERAAEEHMLSRDQAQLTFQNLVTRLDALKTTLRDSVNQLSPMAQEQVRAELQTAEDATHQEAQNILNALE